MVSEFSEKKTPCVHTEPCTTSWGCSHTSTAVGQETPAYYLAEDDFLGGCTQTDSASITTRAMAKAPRLIELRQFDLVKLTKVDVLDQSFKVQFFCLFAFPGGKNDADLMKLEKDDMGKYCLRLTAPQTSPPGCRQLAGFAISLIQTTA